MTALEFVAFDLETTGFDVDDEITVAGFALPLGCRVFVQTGTHDVDETALEQTVRDRTDHHIQCSTHDSETALLEAVGDFATARLADGDYLLVGYNAERWKDGFDLPFLRTRLAATGVAWPFQSLPYADLLPVIDRRFNTSIDGERNADLVGAYGTLCDGALNELDPFDDSAQAVAAFEDGRLADLVVHNIADVCRTAALGDLTQRYCSKSDYDLKSLTARIHDA
ncbi:hypothetical protein [Natrinema sp. 1APR25-10V2]|uniref:hypothetical protein n=1 Tax=Natrinema sp. 1APR25-10V2 TaxID=2951081 RepID=UPI00287701A2|nr:hypothetical protein [Natrinema sp. 1APR25-10V2]MDS0474576.1 hypothetical protein [Natrinema sp. 1APR25-10V2]